jgi:NADP-dependent 3-hydroxy acid dehydrogenase YdfG
MSLEGQVALITGASSGIGLAAAEALSSAGVKLVLSGRREDKLAAHRARLSDCVVKAGDITNPALAGDLIELALTAHGRLDIVLNNAGLNHNAPIEEIDVDLVCEMVRVNVEAAYRMAYTAVKHFRRVGRGHLVNTSSVLGFKVRPKAGAYAGTKYAVEALSEALRLELAGSDIKVTCIEPVLVITDLHRDHAVRPEVAQSVAQPLQPADVAQCILFALQQPAHVAIPRLMVLPQSQEI